MRRTVLLAVLLLCTCLWICSCDAPSEILTVEMHDPYLSDHPMLVSVIFPAETAGEMPQFQIGGDQYTVQHLPTDDDRYHYMEYLWTSEAEPFLPLQKWLEKTVGQP